MKKLLLLSNGKVRGGEFLGYARDWISEHFDASPQNPKKILFVPYAKMDHDAYLKDVEKALNPLGIEVVAAHKVEDPIAELDKVSGVFVGGGNTFRLLDTMQKNGLLEVIKEKVENGMPYMGASAGINIVAPTIRTTNDMPIVQPASFDAMGLVPFQINPHYVGGNLYYKGSGQTLETELEKSGILGKIASLFMMDGGALFARVKEALGLTIYNGETRAERLKEFHEENATPVVGVVEGSGLRVYGNQVDLLGDKSAYIFQKDQEPLEVKDGKVLSELMRGGWKHAYQALGVVLNKDSMAR